MSSRVALALAIGVLGFGIYIGAAAVLAERVLGLHWALQAAYFILAGTAWVIPARALMYWAARGRAGG
jgi:hypothetical protein